VRIETMDVSSAPRGNQPSGLAALLGLFFLLCAVFALIVTLVEWWSEHGQATWPKATATLLEREVEEIGNPGEGSVWVLRCRVTFPALDASVRSWVRSRGSRSITDHARMVDWVNEHAGGSPIPIRWDPRNPERVIFNSDDVPLGGPRAPSDARLVALAGGFGLLSFGLSALLRARGR
jgi:hypothetical protein